MPSDKLNFLISHVCMSVVCRILEDEDSVIQLGEEIQQQSSSVASKVCDDLDSKNSGVAMAALQGLGICLHNKDIVK